MKEATCVVKALYCIVYYNTITCTGGGKSSGVLHRDTIESTVPLNTINVCEGDIYGITS